MAGWIGFFQGFLNYRLCCKKKRQCRFRKRLNQKLTLDAVIAPTLAGRQTRATEIQINRWLALRIEFVQEFAEAIVSFNLVIDYHSEDSRFWCRLRTQTNTIVVKCMLYIYLSSHVIQPIFIIYWFMRLLNDFKSSHIMCSKTNNFAVTYTFLVYGKFCMSYIPPFVLKMLNYLQQVGNSFKHFSGYTVGCRIW